MDSGLHKLVERMRDRLDFMPTQLGYRPYGPAIPHLSCRLVHGPGQNIQRPHHPAYKNPQQWGHYQQQQTTERQHALVQTFNGRKGL